MYCGSASWICTTWYLDLVKHIIIIQPHHTTVVIMGMPRDITVVFGVQLTTAQACVVLLAMNADGLDILYSDKPVREWFADSDDWETLYDIVRDLTEKTLPYKHGEYEMHHVPRCNDPKYPFVLGAAAMFVTSPEAETVDGGLPIVVVYTIDKEALAADLVEFADADAADYYPVASDCSCCS